MRNRWFLAALVITAAAAPSAPAQAPADTGVPTETQERMRSADVEIPWLDLLGLVGLVGLLGLRRPHSDDSYHPAPME